ncbi:hypothetical protein JCM33374_g4980 [Metschnikowia sp. JCM 33374]|nr:hypothetical protein JCM33374_g4980 [Metschnikowia sp. JCM 33374]
MKCSLRLFLAINTYSQPSFVLPQPYVLFHKSLFNRSEDPEKDEPIKTFKTLPPMEPGPLSGLELFMKVGSFKSKQYAESVWNMLNDDQRNIFFYPPSQVNQHRQRIIRGYAESEVEFSKKKQENPFFYTHLYPWEIIKDKLRDRPVFASDVYDQLIQEALAPPIKLFKPTLLYRNWCKYFRNDGKTSGPYSGLDDIKKTKYAREAESKNYYAKRRLEFRRAKQARLKSFDDFKAEFSRESGDSLPESQSTEFIRQQYDFEKYLKSPAMRSSPLNREIKLEIDLAMVMDYIFEYGTVKGCKVNWRQWRAQVCGNYHYIDKIMFPYIINATAENVELLESLPAHLTWKKPLLR